jgi:uncharacterized membrane protein
MGMSKGGAGSSRREPPGPDWIVAGVAATGFGVAGYLAATKLVGGSALFCAAGSGCDIVQASRYASFLGAPTAAWGAGLYGATGALALAGLPARQWLAAFLLAVAGVAFSLYLTYVELFVLRAVCAYCLASAGIAVALLGVLLARRPPATGRRSPARPARAAVLGGLTAAATVILAIALFALGSPRAEASYQEALARHLASSGAAFYGAFW